MRLKSLELYLEWPVDLALQGLRLYVLEHLKACGEPVRWAITSIQSPENKTASRYLKIEAVVIVS